MTENLDEIPFKYFNEASIKGMELFKSRAEKVGLGQTADSFFKTLDYLIQTEVEYRKVQVANSLKNSELKSKHEKKEKEYHGQSISQLEKTINLLKKERSQVEKKIQEIGEDPIKYKKIREEYQKKFKESIFDVTMDPPITIEVLELGEKLFNEVDEKKGIAGVFDLFESKLEELKKARSKESRGREHMSPLVWWKWVAMVAYVVGSVLITWICGLIGGDDLAEACLAFLAGICLHVLGTIAIFC